LSYLLYQKLLIDYISYIVLIKITLRKERASMFSVSKIKNIKTAVVTLLLLPISINCSMILSEDTTLPAKLPKISGTLITGTGLAVALTKGMHEGDYQSKLFVGASAASVIVGYGAYRYLSSFTVDSKYEQASKIIKNFNKKIKKDEIWDTITTESVRPETILQAIFKEHHEADQPTIHFSNKVLKPIIKELKKGKILLQTSLNSLNEEDEKKDENEWRITTFMRYLKVSIIHYLKKPKSETLKNDLEEAINTTKEILEKTKLISTAIRNDDDYKEDYEAYHQKEHNKILSACFQEKTKNLKSQNSYFNALLSNPTFLENFLKLALFFASYILTTITGQSEEAA
jgi:hypothetical protein